MKKLLLFALPLLILLNSCIGMSLDIQMNKDGSGKAVMEYRISKILESIGALDGNKSMPSIPVGKDDWEKTIARNQGTKLSSYSSRETAQETTISVTVDFADDQALLRLLDPFGEKVSINRRGQSGTLDLILYDDSVSLNDELYDEAMMSLMRMFMSGYNVSVSFSGPANSSLTITNGEGSPIPVPPAAKAVVSGRKVSFSMALMDFFELKDGLGLKFNW